MFQYQLYLGLLAEDSLLQELRQLPPGFHDLFIQNQDSAYLQQIEFEGKIYLGKYLGTSIETSSLDSLQTNIYSLLKRLIPYYSYEQHPLLLLAVPSPTPD